jgi:hypothetical protein
VTPHTDAGAYTVAYDGFNGPAGRLKQDGGGSGWSGGWQSRFQGRGGAAEVVDAPGDTVFGFPRAGTQLLRLSEGEAIRRDLASPLPQQSGATYYVSFLLERQANATASSRFFEASLCGQERSPRRRSQREIAFGITSEGFPFIKCGGRITETAARIEDGSVHLCVAKITVSENSGVRPCLRVYRKGDPVDPHEPTAWTTSANAEHSATALSRVRLAVGADAVYYVDELKIGRTWHSVTAFAKTGEEK